MALDNTAADAAVDLWVAAMSPASANPTAVRDAMRPLARALYAGIRTYATDILENRVVVEESSDVTTSSATYADLLSVDITTTLGGYIDILFTASGAHLTNAATTYFQILVDGNDKKGTQTTNAANFGWSAAYSRRVAVAAGTHTVTVRWKTDNVSARINASSLIEEHAHLTVRESF